MPIVPLPESLATAMNIDTHMTIALFGFCIFTFVGLFMLALWVPGYKRSNLDAEMARERINLAFIFLGLAGFSLLFGLYALILGIIALIVGTVWVFVRGVRIMFSKD